jgi:hypothetical protein
VLPERPVALVGHPAEPGGELADRPLPQVGGGQLIRFVKVIDCIGGLVLAADQPTVGL